MDTPADALAKIVQAFHSKLSSAKSDLILNRGDYLCRPGDLNTKIYLIHDGAIQVYRLTEDGKQQSIRFGYEGSIMVVLDSYYSGTPTELFFEALRKTSVSVIDKSSFDAVLEYDAELLKAYSIINEQLILQQMERELDLLTESPELRLKRVLERSPQLFQHIPAKYIASYLRMTPETLSRLRKA